jgi:hypothetical protein
MLRIHTLLIRIRNLVFTLIPMPIQTQILLFNLIRIQIRLFDTDLDPNPYHFKLGNVPKTVLFIHLYLIFLVNRSNRTQPEGMLF